MCLDFCPPPPPLLLPPPKKDVLDIVAVVVVKPRRMRPRLEARSNSTTPIYGESLLSPFHGEGENLRLQFRVLVI